MSHRLRSLLRLLGGLLLAAAFGLASVIAFDSPRAPPIIEGGGAVAGMAAWKMSEVPPIQHVQARDGAPLAYRVYPGRPDLVAVLVHGSTGTGLDMHKVAQALQSAGATAYTISLRGHGGSGTTIGDVSYVGQLDDDLADFMKSLGLDRPGLKRTMIGYSAGGGFTLRTASGRMHAAFDNYIVIAPYVVSYADVRRRHLGQWANAATLRVGGLLLLETLGLPWFQDLPVVRYAVDPHPDARHTPAYTYRLLRSLHMDFLWRREVARIAAPTVILTSSDDDLTNAARYSYTGNPNIHVSVLPKLEHDEMVTAPAAIAGVVGIWRKLDRLNDAGQ